MPRGVKRPIVNGQIQCSTCEEWKDLAFFDLNKGYRYSKCKGCKSLYEKMRRQENPEAQREYNWMRNYGVTREDYNRILKDQGGHCYFCSSSPEYLFVDHDHETGRVRGLLCLSHNQAIAKFGDSAIGVAKLMEYLSKRAESQEVVEVV